MTVGASFRLLILVLAAVVLTAPPARAQGAVATHHYRNLFQEWRPDLDAAAVDDKLQTYWRALFEGREDQRVYYPGRPNGQGPTAYILDAGHDDVRSEGMSYGMMIAVQMNRKAEFDALWNWAASHMRYASGPRRGYFRWTCRRDGCQDDSAPASDGEEYFATALLFAAGRWGNGQGLYDYERQANAILDVMLHKEDMNGGVVEGVTNMFDHATHQVVFVPAGDAARFSDPSYHLPAFYEVWGRRAAGWNGRGQEDRRFWLEAARVSRRYFSQVSDPNTALTPDYALFDGTPKALDGHEDFGFDAHRTAVNWAVDQAWWNADPQAVARTDRLQAFFEREGLGRYPNQFRLDGQARSADRSASLIASNGAASLAASHPRGRDFVAALWALQPPSGPWRYYDGLLQFMAVLHAGGRFRVY